MVAWLIVMPDKTLQSVICWSVCNVTLLAGGDGDGGGGGGGVLAVAAGGNHS